jgi:hypothetical protein
MTEIIEDHVPQIPPPETMRSGRRVKNVKGFASIYLSGFRHLLEHMGARLTHRLVQMGRFLLIGQSW